eukprot:CAMPEP_0170538126 /NCGR_PEP_ID=MMETSP0209-20121228/103126_1 /TAXON_ID=665100 ORGANISM="Litonotus pictus, Strain P1" /NCGR_SAMPLE_ID=MMETSP0209 /ASSEMBLY_ACC=CAM_ASM_000301 /LENGTH=342 /DNA_ID=CAMNT_0010839759 /DNA_START=809 /DNA_END=1834 /DNA_ORIENTATION=+
MIDFMVTNDVYISDDGWLLEDFREIYYQNVDSILYDIINISSGPPVAIVSLLKSPKLRNKSNRNYMKVQELLAKIGGIGNAFFAVMYALTYYYLRFHYFMFIRENTFLLVSSADKLKQSQNKGNIIRSNLGVNKENRGDDNQESSQVNFKDQPVCNKNSSPFINSNTANVANAPIINSNLNSLNLKILKRTNFDKGPIKPDHVIANFNKNLDKNPSNCYSSMNSKEVIAISTPQPQLFVKENPNKKLENLSEPQDVVDSNMGQKGSEVKSQKISRRLKSPEEEYKKYVSHFLFHNEELCFDTSYKPNFLGYVGSLICFCCTSKEKMKKYKYEVSRVKSLFDF